MKSLGNTPPLTREDLVAALRAAGKAVETTNLQGVPPGTALIVALYAAAAELEKDTGDE